MCKRLIFMVFVTLVLAAGQVLAGGYDRAVYYDDDYASGWIGNPEEIRDELEAAGYTVLDADALQTWMEGHVADGKLSVVVFAQDIVPDTVAAENTEDVLLRQYLNAGGKIVWTSDIPFYYVGADDGTTTTWGNNGSVGILGFDASPNTGWDSGNTVTITEDGVAWGLTQTWSSNRPCPVDNWDAMTILALDDAGNAPAWVAHYVADDTCRGFVRTSDFSGSTASIADLMALAEYAVAFDTATDPSPESASTDVERDVVLSWSPSDAAATHDVYFGTSFDDVNAASRDNPLDVLVSQGQAGTTYDPEGLLEFGTTYYWRIDEVNAAPDNTAFKGDIWSFTTEPYAYAVENIVATCSVVSDAGYGPENTINGSGLNEDDQHSVDSADMWQVTPAADETVYLQYEFDGIYKLHEMLVWNYNVQWELILGFGVKNATVEYSVDGTDWIGLGDVELAQATAAATYEANTTVAFDGVAAKYVRLTVNSGYGSMGQYGLSEVRFMYIPAQAREPQPADGAADVDVTTTLAWRAGRDAISHEVYLGTDAEALELAGTPATTSYSPADLNLDVTYSWMVTEVQDAEAWDSSVWSFSTEAYLVVDDFESYNDEDNLIYETWIDGWTNGTGSTVGYAVEPFAETTTVHGGSQSMPLFYDNAGFDTSEAVLDLNQDWTTHGVKSLSLYFYGDADNSGGQLFVRINNTEIAYDGAAVNITRPAWQLWSIDLAAVGNVSNVNSLTVGVEGAGAQGVIYIDDVCLYPEVIENVSSDITGPGDTVQGVPNDGVTTGNNDNGWPSGEYPDLAIDDDTSTKFLHFKGNAETTGLQVTPLVGATVITGLTFTTANDAAERDPTSFELYGSNDSIDGAYTLIASGDIVDFAGETAWERYTKTTTPITFDNDVAYTHYQILFPTIRDAGSANSMQIGEVELLGSVAQ